MRVPDKDHSCTIGGVVPGTSSSGKLRERELGKGHAYWCIAVNMCGRVWGYIYVSA